MRIHSVTRLLRSAQSVKFLCVASVAVLLIAVAISADDAPPPRGKIAITFDNLPASHEYTRAERYEFTNNILQTLSKYNVHATGFVVGDNIESDWEILVAWSENGHKLGNGTFSNHDLHMTNSDLFIEDMVKGATTLESFLSGLGQKGRFFRFPYLHYGESPAVRQRIEKLLTDRDYVIAPVSIDADDYRYNLTMEGLRNSEDTVLLGKLRQEYLEHIANAIFHAEDLAQMIMQRPVRHILSLHVNRINSRYLDDVLKEIESAGFEFITLDEAIKDPVYKKQDTYFGPNGLSKLERIALSRD